MDKMIFIPIKEARTSLFGLLFFYSDIISSNRPDRTSLLTLRSYPEELSYHSVYKRQRFALAILAIFPYYSFQYFESGKLGSIDDRVIDLFGDLPKLIFRQIKEVDGICDLFNVRLGEHRCRNFELLFVLVIG